jgi:hypothetical protein
MFFKSFVIAFISLVYVGLIPVQSSVTITSCLQPIDVTITVRQIKNLFFMVF